MVYLLVNPRYQIPHRCFTSSRHPERRNSSITRSHALRFGLTSYLKPRPRFVRFCSFRIDVWSSLTGPTSLRELARKLQTMHRWGSSLWGSFKTRRAEGACTEASDSIEYRAGGTSDCCEKVLEIQSSQMCCSQDPIGIIWRKKN